MHKKNMMPGVTVACTLVIFIVVLLIIKGQQPEEWTFAFWTFFRQHKYLLIYLIVINLVTFAAFTVDKVNAVRNKSRIRIITLLGLAFVGGTIGGLAAMYLFHHKTRKDYFAVGLPLMFLMQAVVIFYVMNFF